MMPRTLAPGFDGPEPLADRAENDEGAPVKPKQTETLDVLQEWEEYVVRIGNTDFTAELLDLTAGASFAEGEADIPLTFLTDGDVAKIQAESVFRWTIRLRALGGGNQEACLPYRVARPWHVHQGRPAGRSEVGMQNDQGVQPTTEELRASLIRLRARGKDS